MTERQKIIQVAQWAVAEAMASFHSQLRAALRGDEKAARDAHLLAADATQRAIFAARQILEFDAAEK